MDRRQKNLKQLEEEVYAKENAHYLPQKIFGMTLPPNYWPTPGIEPTRPSAGAEAIADEEARSAEGGGAVERGGGGDAKLSEDSRRLILNALETKIPSEILWENIN